MVCFHRLGILNFHKRDSGSKIMYFKYYFWYRERAVFIVNVFCNQRKISNESPYDSLVVSRPMHHAFGDLDEIPVPTEQRRAQVYGWLDRGASGTHTWRTAIAEKPVVFSQGNFVLPSVYETCHLLLFKDLLFSDNLRFIASAFLSANDLR